MASSGDRVLGTFAVYHPVPQAPAPESEEIVAMVSPLAAIAIERKTFEDRLAYQAQHDPLTGLPNRVLFVEFLTLALARARSGARRRRPCCSSTSTGSRSSTTASATTPATS